MARAIALLQTAEKLQYDLYNIGSGKPTPNHELLAEIKRAVPNFTVNLPPGRFPFPPLPLMETKRLEADTGFSPEFDTRSGVQDYVAWLKAGNPRLKKTLRELFLYKRFPYPCANSVRPCFPHF